MKKTRGILIILGIILIIIAVLCYLSGSLELLWAGIIAMGGIVSTLKYTNDFILWLYNRYKTIDELVPKYSIENIKGKIKVLWIDNDMKLYKEIVDYFNANGYSIKTEKDIKKIDDVKDYQIILCDIDGVGGKIAPGNKGNGIDVILRTNENFPSKFLVIVTGYLPENILNIMSTSIRWFVKEDLCLESLKLYLDGWIKDYLNPVYFWEKIFLPTLLKKSFTSQMIKTVEKAYIRDWENHSLNSGNLEKSELYKLKSKGEFKKYSEVMTAIVEYVIF